MQLPFRLVRKTGTPGSVHPHRPGIDQSRLLHHIPEHAAGYILEWFGKNDVHFRISKARSSKFGDYRNPANGHPARISVNRNLNRYDFLLTLVHEMAHHEVCKGFSASAFRYGYSRRKRGNGPHGKEWKNSYRTLMNPLMNEAVFPADLLPLVVQYFDNPRSSSRMNRQLVMALKNYDEPDGSVFIDHVPDHAIFVLAGGRRFRKGEKLRKRYRCMCLDNGKTYLFSPAAKVFPEAVPVSS